MRHIEAVRNYLNKAVSILLTKGEYHDQSKLQEPELTIFDEYTPKLRDITYGSEEYKTCMKEMKPAIEHHNANNRHHPEHFVDGINDMNLFDLIELICDWKAATLRHNNGNILKSLEINKERFNISDQLYDILVNIVDLSETEVYHHAEES
jgi:hypothetical protein